MFAEEGAVEVWKYRKGVKFYNFFLAQTIGREISPTKNYGKALKSMLIAFVLGSFSVAYNRTYNYCEKYCPFSKMTNFTPQICRR